MPLPLRLLRSAALSLGVSLSHASTDAGVRALRTLGPGRGVDLSGGIRLERGFDRWILQRSGDFRWEEVSVGGGTPSEGILHLGRRRFRYRWGSGGPGARDTPAAPSVDVVPEPGMTLRGWRPGDRIRMPYGSKAVAKLLAERGVAAVDRPSTPVLVSADGGVVWVPGTARAERPASPSAPATFSLSCVEEPGG